MLKTFCGWRDKQLPDGTGILAGYTPSYSATTCGDVLLRVPSQV
jgi:hypothetical protein